MVMLLLCGGANTSAIKSARHMTVNFLPHYYIHTPRADSIDKHKIIAGQGNYIMVYIYNIDLMYE